MYVHGAVEQKMVTNFVLVIADFVINLAVICSLRVQSRSTLRSLCSTNCAQNILHTLLNQFLKYCHWIRTSQTNIQNYQ